MLQFGVVAVDCAYFSITPTYRHVDVHKSINTCSSRCYVPQVGGSSANCDKSVDHKDGQIFSPPYLFNADGTTAKRPVLSSPPTTTVKVGGKLTVTVDMANAKLVLIRIGSATHSVNSDQRRIPLTDVSIRGGSYTATLPAESGILIPGHYYLFAVSSTGVPSVAKTIKITV